MAREQTLTWYKLEEREPDLNKVIIMKVPDITWVSTRKIINDFKYVIGWMEKTNRTYYGNQKRPYHFETFGTTSYFYDDVEEWAYL